MNDYISILGLIISVLIVGVSVGRFVEKIEGFIHRNDDDTHKKHKSHKHTKNDRR